jgi:ribonuclease Z
LFRARAIAFSSFSRSAASGGSSGAEALAAWAAVGGVPTGGAPAGGAAPTAGIRATAITDDLKYHPPLARAAAGADILISEAIATSLTRSLGRVAHDAGRDNTAAIMHDIEDYHITPEQAAQIANDANVKLLVYYHLLPAPDNALTRRLFAHGVSSARRGDWTIADDGSLYTLPLGSTDVVTSRIDR